MERLAQINVNTVYPTVWNWGYTLYPSQVADRVIGAKVDPDPGFEGRDMLAEIVKIGKQKGIRVIPWFEFGFMAPADSELARRRPQWLTNRRDGTQIKMEGEHPRVWLNPFHPEVQQFMIDLVVEMVEKYDIQGVQLDDHFGLPSEYGYDEFTVELYKQENAGQTPPDDPKNPEWLRWRADKITQFKKRLFDEIKKRKQECIVALSPNPQRFSYEEFLADWESWERQGLVEELVVQIYRNDINAFAAELDREEMQNARKHIPVGVGILAGLKGKPVSMEQIQEQLETVRNKGYAGVSFFFYESMWNWAPTSPEERQAAFGGLFPETMAAPDLSKGWEPEK
ncbi:MAG: glycoside hydrolase family 10 protein [Oscillatoriaceae cyanobacterium]